jgi:hypothetical protein
LVRKQVRRVQILDPAAGTGTFLNEVIKLVYSRFKDQEGLWPGFVENELLQPTVLKKETQVTKYQIFSA